MKRGQAERLIDKVRRLEAEHRDCADGDCDLHMELQELLEDVEIPPLARCTGEAHSNPHMDNCPVCAPRWGWVGERVKVT